VGGGGGEVGGVRGGVGFGGGWVGVGGLWLEGVVCGVGLLCVCGVVCVVEFRGCDSSEARAPFGITWCGLFPSPDAAIALNFLARTRNRFAPQRARGLEAFKPLLLPSRQEMNTRNAHSLHAHNVPPF